jgi:hypothetical protein
VIDARSCSRRFMNRVAAYGLLRFNLEWSYEAAQVKLEAEYWLPESEHLAIKG